MSYWLNNALSYLTTDKDMNSILFMKETMNKTQQMFKYTNLPTTLPQNKLERILQHRGSAFITLHEGHLFAFEHSYGGKRDVYGDPIEAIVNNEALKIQGTKYQIGVEGILMSNVEDRSPLTYKVAQYAALQTESMVSLRLALINMRTPYLLEATDESAYESAKMFLEQLEDGYLGIIETDPLDGSSALQAHPYATGGKGTITELIEVTQYLKSNFYSDLGINLNENMKSQYVNEGEMNFNDDATKPLVDNMLACRQRAVDELNALFGLEITVELTSAWAGKQKEVTQNEESYSDEETGDSIQDGSTDETEEEEESSQEETEGNDDSGSDEEVNPLEAEVEDTLETPLSAGEVADTHRVLNDEEPQSEELEVIINESMETERVDPEEEDNQEGQPEADETTDSDETDGSDSTGDTQKKEVDEDDDKD